MGVNILGIVYSSVQVYSRGIELKFTKVQSAKFSSRRGLQYHAYVIIFTSKAPHLHHNTIFTSQCIFFFLQHSLLYNTVPPLHHSLPSLHHSFPFPLPPPLLQSPPPPFAKKSQSLYYNSPLQHNPHFNITVPPVCITVLHLYMQSPLFTSQPPFT